MLQSDSCRSTVSSRSLYDENLTGLCFTFHLHSIRIIQKRFSFTLCGLPLMCSMARWDRFTQITNNLIHLHDTFQSEFSLFPLHNKLFFKSENFLHSSHKSFHFWVQFLSGSQRFWRDSFLFFFSKVSHNKYQTHARSWDEVFLVCSLRLWPSLQTTACAWWHFYGWN